MWAGDVETGASAIRAMLRGGEEDEELAHLGELMVAEVLMRIRGALMPSKKKKKG